MQTITLIPGDGIGEEIVASVKQVLAAAGAEIRWEEAHAGLGALEKTGKLMSDELVVSLLKHKVALKGPTTTPVGGGHRSINVTMRQQFDLFANVRPIRALPGLPCAHPEIDLVIVRENTEDLYKGIEYMVGDDVAHGIKLITASASERIGRFAFELAKKLGRRKVTIVHKANIMKMTDGLFLRSVQKVAKDYPDIICDDCIIDNCCMQLVTRPEQFDIIVTENLYGDILSDLCSGLIGGLGVASGANIGEDSAIFEAVHGSAPDIAGMDLANPTALILSAVSMLEYLGQNQPAKKVRNALFATLGDASTRTKDLGGKLGTKAFTDAVVENLKG